MSATLVYDEAAVAAAELELRARSIIRAHTEYQTDPIGWAVDKLGIPEHTLKWSLNAGYDRHDWDGDVDPLAQMCDYLRDWKDVAVESATGIGKSYVAAILILWFLACWENSQVFTFALTADQLKLFIWRNITELWPRFSAWFPTAQLSTLSIRMRGGIDETWAANGRPVQLRAGETVASRAQGMHEENMLLVYEEAAAMEWAIIEAGRNTCTRPHNLRLFIGNPNHQLDSLHRVSKQPGVKALRASALDHPNVVSPNPNTVPGTISREKIESRREEYGETDPVFLSRVRGISPEQAANALIRLEWLKRSALRYEARRLLREPVELGLVPNFTALYPDAKNRPGYLLPLPSRVTGKGVDAANSEHGDRGAIVDFAGTACIRVLGFPCPDSNKLGADVVAEAHRHGLEGRRVGVDAIGVGAGTVNEARRLGFVVQSLYAGGAPMVMAEKAPDGKRVEWSPDVNLFKNLRGQMLWQAREDLRTDQIDVEENRALWEELTAPTFEDNNKVVEVEAKDDIRLRLGRSPDLADAFVMANWVRERAVVPKPKQEEQGRTLGYDYANRKPMVRQTAEQELQAVFSRQRGDVLGDRYSVPMRRG